MATQDPTKTGDMSTYMAFFPGCSYVFVDNPVPDLCWVNNFSCTGVKLLLDPNEPDDDLTQPVRVLTYPPVAICVRPDGTSLGKLFPGRDVPADCLPVSRTRKGFKAGVSY